MTFKERLLCRLGFHNWDPNTVEEVTVIDYGFSFSGTPYIEHIRKCRTCGKVGKCGWS